MCKCSLDLEEQISLQKVFHVRQCLGFGFHKPRKFLEKHIILKGLLVKDKNHLNFPKTRKGVPWERRKAKDFLRYYRALLQGNGEVPLGEENISSPLKLQGKKLLHPINLLSELPLHRSTWFVFQTKQRECCEVRNGLTSFSFASFPFAFVLCSIKKVHLL